MRSSTSLSVRTTRSARTSVDAGSDRSCVDTAPRRRGAELDLDALEPYLAVPRGPGIDGSSCSARPGEGMNLRSTNGGRRSSVQCTGPLPVIAHCGAQTTAATVALCEHAARSGVEGVAVIAPPYFVLDEARYSRISRPPRTRARRRRSTRTSCRAASGYAIPPLVIERLRDAVDNLVGMKVSDAPFEKRRALLLDGLDVLIGAEALIGEGLAAGAAGAVSGLASAFPRSSWTRCERRLDVRPASCARGSSGSHAMPRSRRSCGRAECRCVRTSGGRCARSTTPSAASSSRSVL